MTEIPEHLMQRAREARAKAAGQPSPPPASPDAADIPPHLLERARYAQRKSKAAAQAPEAEARVVVTQDAHDPTLTTEDLPWFSNYLAGDLDPIYDE